MLDLRRNGPASAAVSGRMVVERMPQLTEPDRRLADMDLAGVDVQVVSPSPVHTLAVVSQVLSAHWFCRGLPCAAFWQTPIPVQSVFDVHGTVVSIEQIPHGQISGARVNPHATPADRLWAPVLCTRLIVRPVPETFFPRAGAQSRL